MIPDAELTDEEILIAITEADYSPVMSNGVPIGKGFHEKLDLIKGKTVAKAAIEKYRAALATVPDEEMVKVVAKYLVSTHPVSPEMDAEAIVSLIQPIYTARHENGAGKCNVCYWMPYPEGGCQNFILAQKGDDPRNLPIR